MAAQETLRPVAVIGAGLDLGAGRRGVDMGPSAIRYAGLQERIERLGRSCVDWGDVGAGLPEATEVGDPRARYLDSIKRSCGRVAALVGEARERGHLPLVLGGDHSVAIGTLGGLARAHGPGAVDPLIAPGVGTPVPGGLSYREAHLVAELVAESGLLDSLELVEVNPVLDRANETGLLAVELAASALGARIL